MKICCLSDLHGYTPLVPDCDLLLIAGDISGPSDLLKQIKHLQTKFKDWLEEISRRNISIVGIAGNHEICATNKLTRELFLSTMQELPWTYLEDSYTIVDGLKIWGSPWSLTFGYGWAFNAAHWQLEQIYSRIPDDVGIIISHGPAYTILDKTYDGRQTGSVALLEKVGELSKKSLKLLSVGHIHEGAGQTKYLGVTCVNASYVDEDYFPNNPIITVDI